MDTSNNMVVPVERHGSGSTNNNAIHSNSHSASNHNSVGQIMSHSKIYDQRLGALDGKSSQWANIRLKFYLPFLLSICFGPFNYGVSLTSWNFAYNSYDKLISEGHFGAHYQHDF